MSVSASYRGSGDVSGETRIEDLLEIARNPAKYQEIVDGLRELREGQEKLNQARAELEIREQAAAALAAGAARTKSEYERRAVALDGLKTWIREQNG